jgi:hypothetical protein
MVADIKKLRERDEKFRHAWLAHASAGGSNTEFAAKLGITVRKLLERRRAVEKRLGIDLPSMLVSKNSIARGHSEAMLDALQGYAPEHDMTHPVPDGFTVGGVSTLYTTGEDGQTRVAAQWVKSKQDAAARERLLREAAAAFAESLPRVEPRKAERAYLSDVMTAYPIGDAHIGMRAWREETGADWDLAIAERTQCGAMAMLVESMPATESALIVNLGDWFHYDSMVPMTPRSGNMLDADGRYAKMIRVGVKVMRQCVESALSKHKTVRVVNVIGNHDETGALWLSAALAGIYENEPRVTVDTSPALFTYVEFGKTLIGMHHGHTCRAEKLPGVMAADKPEAWGRTTHRYWWLGHVHHQSVREFPGVTIETFNTLASNDAYAAGGGWRSRENMKAILLHREHGEVGRNTVNPAMLATTVAA